MGIDHYFNNEDVLDFIDEFNTHYPTASGIQGGGAQIFEDYEIPYTPSLILIAPDHTIVEQSIPRPIIAQDLIEILESYNFSLSGVGESTGKENFDFSFSPNPVINSINIRSEEGKKINQIKIYELTGQEVFSKSYSNSFIENPIDISYLHQGIYLLSVEIAHGQRVTKTFVKQ